MISGTKFDQYMRAVEMGEFPEDPLVPPRDPPFINESGSIINLALGQFGGLARIVSRPGALRSNHYHKTDWHFLFVESGTVHYYWRKAGSKADPQMTVFRAGDVFFTPPMVEHAVYSPRSSEILSLSRMSRRHEDHEADLVRVQLVKKEGDAVVIVR